MNTTDDTFVTFFNVDRRHNVNLGPIYNRNASSAANVNTIRGDLIQTTFQNSQSTPSLPIHFGTINSDPNFTGRSDELSDLHKNLHHIVVVCGLGGIGKTSIVRAFLENKKFRSYNIVWINAIHSASIQNDFESLAKNRLSITTVNADGEKKDFESIANEVLSKLCDFPTLMVLDNVDDEEAQNFACDFVLNVNPSGKHKPNFIITSRIQNWGSNSEHVIRVQGLIDTDAIKLVNKLLTNCKPNNKECRDSPEDKKELVQLLQNFPLTIRQATAYINYQRVVQSFSITKYIDKYNVHKKEYLDSKYFQNGSKYRETTYTTWRVTISAIEKNPSVGNLALRILRIIAYFEANHILRDIFLHLNHPLSENIIDKQKIVHSIRLLVEYSMIEGRAHQSILSVHRLVQDVMKINLESDDAKMSRAALHDGLNILYKALYEDYAKAMKEQHFEDVTKTLEHAMSVFGASISSHVLVEEFSFFPSIVLEAGNGCGRYHQCMIFGLKILPQFVGIFGETHRYVIDTKIAVANVCLKAGNYAEALRIFENVYADLVRFLGEDHPKTTDIKFQIDKMRPTKNPTLLQYFYYLNIFKRNCCILQ